MAAFRVRTNGALDGREQGKQKTGGEWRDSGA
jgi:hypothetical protein